LKTINRVDKNLTACPMDGNLDRLL